METSWVEMGRGFQAGLSLSSEKRWGISGVAGVCMAGAFGVMGGLGAVRGGS